jgi:Transglycosylase
MLRVIGWTALATTILALVALGGATFYVWRLGEDTFNDAQAAGWFEPLPPAAAATTFETIVQKSQFNKVWNDRGFVCSTFASAWGTLTGEKQKGGGIAVPLANRLVWETSNRDGTLESHLRRASLVCALENRFSDLQMLRIYLRKARFDGVTRGSEEASRALFAKPTAQLDAEESVRLTALFESRRLHDRPDEWNKRSDHVRKRLLDAGNWPGDTR